MKTAIAILVPTIGTHYKFAAALPEGNFYVSNGDEELTEKDLGMHVLIRYNPQDLFCKVITMDIVENALSSLNINW